MSAADVTSSDPFVAARTVADAVLYEGYVLYPYRASARKNQLRWQFGVLAPPAYAASEGSERSTMRTEVVADPGGDARVAVRIRCLQVQHRSVEAAQPDGSFTPAEVVAVDGVQWVGWDEAVEHDLDVAVLPLLPVTDEPVEVPLVLDAGDSTEPLTDSDGRVVGRAVRRRERVDGLVKVATAWAEGTAGLVKLTVEVQCCTDWRGEGARRDAVMARSLVAVHTLLAARDAEFVSLLDPPASAREAVAGCANDGTFPVLIGAEGESQVVLSSPIILYDHPAVAPESAGDFCDATEIDEILALRVLTLTDEEKAEARGTDRRAAAIVDRCDDMPPEVWERLHGAVRSIGPAAAAAETEPDVLPWWEPAVDASVDPWTDTTWVGGVEVGKGTPVRLNPSRRADAHDLFLAGRTLPDGVRAADFGIRGVHLAYELLDGYDALVLVDAVPMGEPPGTVAIIEPELEPRGGDCGAADDGPAPALDAHSMNPAVVLGMLSSLGGRVDRVLVVGCQPSVIEEGIGLSSPVAAAVDRAVDAVLEALAELCVPNEERSGV